MFEFNFMFDLVLEIIFRHRKLRTLILASSMLLSDNLISLAQRLTEIISLVVTELTFPS